jgi:uncharacterized membrane protein
MKTPTSPSPEPRAGATDAIVRNVRAVAELARQSALHRSAVERFSDRVTYLAGTTWSLLWHGAFFAGWIAVNLLVTTPFDPFPFARLTTLVSLEAIFLTLFVLSSQNRLTADTDHRAQIELQVNLLAEQEMTLVLRMLRDLCERSNVPLPEGLTELLHDVNIEQVAATVARELPDPKKSAAFSESGEPR